MAKGKKSSLDMDEPVVVQGEEVVSEPIVEETPTVVKAEKKPAVEVKEQKKAETQEKTVEKKTKRGVKICVM